MISDFNENLFFCVFIHCETLRVVSDWVANAAARNERDVMANGVVFVSKNRGIRLLSERECKEMMSFPTVSAHTCNTRKLAKPYFNAYSISSGHSYLLDVVCCCARELPVAWSPLDTIVFISKMSLFTQKEACRLH